MKRWGAIVSLVALVAACVAACAPTPLPAPTPAATHTAAAPSPSPAPAALAYPAGATGYSISWPQCGGPYPAAPFDIGMVGVTDGIAFTHNPCFASEWAWASSGRYPPTVYWNVNYVECGQRDAACDPYAYGRREAQDALEYAAGNGAHPTTWWLDIQIVSDWSKNPAHNAEAIQGAIDFFRDQGLRPAISSTGYQLSRIAGDFRPGLTSFVAAREGLEGARAYCGAGDVFAGRGTELTAYVADGYEQVVSCGPQP